MSLFEQPGRRRATPVSTELPHTPGRILSRRVAGRSIMIAGGVVASGGFGKSIQTLSDELTFIKDQAEKAFPAPPRDELRQAQNDFTTGVSDAQEKVSQAFSRGEAVTLTPPTYLQQAHAVIEREKSHQAELTRLAQEGRSLTKGAGALLIGLSGALATALGFFTVVAAESKTRKNEIKFKGGNQIPVQVAS